MTELSLTVRCNTCEASLPAVVELEQIRWAENPVDTLIQEAWKVASEQGWGLGRYSDGWTCPRCKEAAKPPS